MTIPYPLAPPPAPRILVLGIGNILWADEGFGVRAVEAFHKAYELSDNVTILDGGTQGLYLVQFVNEHDRLIVFDAIDYGLEPGTMKVVEDDEVPKFTGAKKMSLHQTGFQEVLSAADFMGHYPERLTLIGCQPLDLEDWGGPLTAPVRGVIPAAIETAVRVLRSWGVAVTARPEGAAVPPLLEHDIDFERYERRAEPAALNC
ncbi:HyaD/HybD family hydrogenase maturation endopeptidase [Rhizobium beringeri]|uniref:Hydrogenase expression/formation protein HupD n=3 Tax=Rhizobium TaxID=379 RepID=A0A154I8Z3_RHILE|nr:HyaD/HybD family hydrogenase maturation endopeptidase [Rhizobium leguminosarum]ANP91047.1 hydrogenase expression/formation protein [Rhizobium leguminosarum]API57602.1 hydrogenase expression/formation protein [Rhizobium leguminosarum]KZA96881.1 hydrogenase expression/formation protein [Rhizobium leguminosarum]OAP90903.1 hydrogenase expression/formation protein [Rhizobium leguminosarum]UIK01449.1 HyaD/HybD family hydrogenase maturation endopeptidase [Rhizobium leguminosarum]